MADRDPLRASDVLRQVLGRKTFDWHSDGEKLMRQRKSSFFDREPLPRLLPISTRLAPYVGSPYKRRPRIAGIAGRPGADADRTGRNLMRMRSPRASRC